MLAAWGRGASCTFGSSTLSSDVIVAQVLLTRQDVEDRHRYLTVLYL